MSSCELEIEANFKNRKINSSKETAKKEKDAEDRENGYEGRDDDDEDML